MYICATFEENTIERGDESPLFLSSMIAKKKIQELAEERMAHLGNGLYIVELTVSPSNVIHMEIDKAMGNVSVEDCMSVSRNIEHNLDREEQDFELHVSSAGLDKPLRVLAQYEKNVGRDLKLVLVNGAKMLGKLVECSDKGIVIEQERIEKIEGKKKKELVVDRSNHLFSEIKEAKIIITFK